MGSIASPQASFDRGEFAAVEIALANSPGRACSDSLLLARAYLAMGRAAEAVQILQQTVEENPGNVELFYYLGCALGHVRNYQEAASVLGRALTLGYEKARLQRGHAFARLGLLDEAAADYEEAASRGFERECSEALERIGILWSRRNRPLQAARLLNRALTLGNKSDTLLWESGRCLYRLGRYPETIARWSELAQRYPNNERVEDALRSAAWMNGMSELANGHEEAAIDSFVRIAADESVSKAIAEIHFRAAARAIVDFGDPEAARKHLQEALRVCPGDQRVAYYLALLTAQRSPEVAAGILRKSTAPRCLFALALFLFRSGHSEEARGVWSDLSTTAEAVEWNERARIALVASLVDEGKMELARKVDGRESVADRLAFGQVVESTRSNDWSNAAVLTDVLTYDPERYDRMLHDTRLAAAVATVCILGGDHRKAAEICMRTRRGDLVDHTITHLLFTSGYWAASKGSRTGLAVAPQLWRQMSENAAVLLNAEEYCQQWCAARARVYGVPSGVITVLEFQRTMEQRLLERLPISSAAGMELRIELNGAQSLQKLGGVPTPDPRAARVICGPAMLRRLTLAGALGNFIRALTENREASARNIQRVVRYYSSLAPATTLLEFGRPREALEALRQARCETCATKASPDDSRFPSTCRADCASFAIRNPAHTRFDRPGETLLRDALELAADASVADADRHIAGARISAEAISSAWGDAIFFAQHIEIGASIEAMIASRAQGGCWILIEKGRFDEAITVVETARTLCERFRDQLAGKLSEALNYRGVLRADASPPDPQGAADDYRRSIDLNPWVPVVWRNMVLALQRLAVVVELRKAEPLLTEAREYLDQARQRFSGELWLDDVTSSLEATCRRLAFDLNELGLSTAAEGLLKTAADLLEMAARLAPDVEDVRENFCRVTAEHALALFRSGRIPDARQTIEVAWRCCPNSREVIAARKAIA